MFSEATKNHILALVEQELDRLHRHHIDQAKRVAHAINPRLTDEDLLNPDNFPEVIADPRFTYADGIAAGVLSAKIALRAALSHELTTATSE